MKKLFVISAVALALAACSKKEEAPVADAPVAEASAPAPAADASAPVAAPAEAAK